MTLPSSLDQPLTDSLSQDKPIQTTKASKYSVPALERGLDVLELLATQSTALTKTQIARQLGKSPNEVFRTLECLATRNYIAPKNARGEYYLTMRLHQLANTLPASKKLLEVSSAEMPILTEETGLSCHLSVYNGGKIYVVSQVDSPLPLSLKVRVGVEFSMVRTASGRVLLAFQNPKVANHWLEAIAQHEQSQNVDFDGGDILKKRLETIRNQGYELSDSDRIQGLKDISCPILNSQNIAIAALTVPYLTFMRNGVDIDIVKQALIQTSKKISALLPM